MAMINCPVELLKVRMQVQSKAQAQAVPVSARLITRLMEMA